MFLSKLKAWRESTATSPSGLHLGHYKAMVVRHSHSDDIDDQSIKQDLDQIQSDLLTVHLSLINYALTRGYSYQRWQQVVNTMLLKEPGNFRIHRTRVIHIYEADYNLALGLKWREALFESEREGIINDGQYGSRPRRNAHDPVFLELLENEISRVSRKSLVQTNYDASSCYDRILVWLSTLASRKFGVPLTVAQMNARTLERAEYRLRTELGISATGYSHSPDAPIHGTGQGSGNSPMIWCFLSSLLFDCYQSRATGAHYECPDRSLPTPLHMIGYVDDSNGQTNRFCQEPQPSLEELLTIMQRDAQLWNDLLWTSGGELELSKCSYQILHWTFTSEGAPILSGGTPGTPVRLRNALGRRIKLHHLSAHTSHKTLGHYIAPSGNQAMQQRHLQQKSDAVATMITTSTLNRKEAWTYYFAIYLPSIGYPLANTHFPRQTLHNIQRKAMSALFAKCGYNRNTHRAIMFATTHFGGAGFRHLYAEQGVAQLQQFIRSWRQPHTQKGRLLRIAVSWVQFALGTGTSFLRETQQELPHMEALWFNSLRQFLRDITGQLEIAPSYVRPLAREFDCFLMDRVLSSTFTPKQIRQINYCRLYLRVTLLSDITNAAGTIIDASMYQGCLDQTAASSSNWHAITQARPAPASWTQWRKALKLWSSDDLRLHQPLGVWFSVADSSPSRKWRTYVHEDLVYHRVSEDQYRVFFSQESQQYRYEDYLEVDTFQNIPLQAIPVDANLSEEGILHVSRPVTFRETSDILEPPSDLRHYILQQDTWERELLQHWSSTSETYALRDKLLHNRFYAACDGSATLQYAGSFGWIISTQLQERLCRASGPVRGYRITAYRAEATGMLSLSRFLTRLADYTGISSAQWTVTYACDNHALVQVVNKMLRYVRRPRPSTQAEDLPMPLDPLVPDWDVLSELYYTIRSWPHLSVIHVLGHQDSRKSYDELPLPVQLNVDADKLAGEYHHFDPDPKPWALVMPHTGVHLHCESGTITYKYERTMRLLESTPAVTTYLKARHGWSDSTFANINWEAHGKACRRISPNRRVHTIKMIHDAIPTNKVIHRYDSRQSPLCPRCKQEIESRDHVVQCLQAAQWRQHFLETLNQRCIALNTRTALRELLLLGISHWMSQIPTLPDLSNYDEELTDLMQQQMEIGWRQLLSGRLSIRWSLLQGLHMGDSPGCLSSPRGTQWTAHIILHMWQAWYEVWDARNAVVHGIDHQSHRSILREQLISRLQRLYANRNHVEPSLARVFATPEESIAQRGITYLQNWLTIAEPMVERSIRTVTQRAIQNVRDIRSYLLPRTSIPPT